MKEKMKEKLYLYDTTLRDGQQGLGVQFSVEEKQRIARALDELGVDYIEGGWPGANPTDSEFFAKAPKTKATFTAFGMTKRAGHSAANDAILAEVINAGTRAVCIVGKSHDFHVHKALGISLEENIDNIRESIAHIVGSGREAIFDAEHFFDGYKANPDYACACVRAALDAGARWAVLCDTNGGTLPADIARIVRALIAAKVDDGTKLGIHTHNDTENAVAGTLAAIDAGARHVQGTLNGIGERCGNANIISVISTLALKEPYCTRFTISVKKKALASLTKISRILDDILNRVPNRAAAYVGASAFAHKAGLHVSAIQKDPTTYEHVDPAKIGNVRTFPMSNQAGLSNLKRALAEQGYDTLDKRMLSAILRDVKAREDMGYSYDTARASFNLIAYKHMKILPDFFEIERYRVIAERRKSPESASGFVSFSEAIVVVNIDGHRYSSVSESIGQEGEDNGPVNALARALAKDLGPYQDRIKDLRLVDFKVRIISKGTEARTRVIIDSEDDSGMRWSTVGVSANIIDASFEALIDSIKWKLFVEEKDPQKKARHR